MWHPPMIDNYEAGRGPHSVASNFDRESVSLINRKKKKKVMIFIVIVLIIYIAITILLFELAFNIIHQ